MNINGYAGINLQYSITVNAFSETEFYWCPQIPYIIKIDLLR
jgi:hypothetical protein